MNKSFTDAANELNISVQTIINIYDTKIDIHHQTLTQVIYDF